MNIRYPIYEGVYRILTMDVGAWIVIPSILSLLLWIEPDISCTERLLYMFFSRQVRRAAITVSLPYSDIT